MYIQLRTYKNNRISSTVIKSLKSKYKITQLRGDLPIEENELLFEIKTDYTKEAIHLISDEILFLLPDIFKSNYEFSAGFSVPLGYINSFYLQLNSVSEKIVFGHRIKEIKK